MIACIRVTTLLPIWNMALHARAHSCLLVSSATFERITAGSSLLIAAAALRVRFGTAVEFVLRRVSIVDALRELLG